MRLGLVTRASVLVVAMITAGCGEPERVGPSPSKQDDSQDSGSNGAKQGSGSGKAKQGKAQGPSEAKGKKADAGAPEFTDDDFVERGVKSRDPFRSFVETFEVEAPKKVQRRVLMPETSVDQMKLIAIISGVTQPKAMLSDPAGVGHVVQRGDYIGRPEVVKTGGAEGMPVTLNWRVDRIRSDEVVLARKDPTSPGDTPLTRVLPLYQEGEREGFKKGSAKVR
jgi:type IV pilus assembly protein PilP